jgi:hypothetical protein
MFVVEGGLWNFDLFDANAGHIQLLVVLFLQTIFIPWVVGMHKMSQIMYFRNGEYVPIFYILVIRIFVPIFSIIITIIAIVNEFGDTDGRKAKGWNQGHIWGARLIWLLPLIIMVILMFVPLKGIKTFDELVAEQYGIKLDDSNLTQLQRIYAQKCEFTVIDQAVYNRLKHKGEPKAA